MKRFLTAVVLLLFISVPVMGHSWVSTAEKVRKSIVQLKNLSSQGFCTGWVIDNRRDFVITADHCVHNDITAFSPIYIDGIMVAADGELWGSEELDVAVLHVPGIDRPELKPYLKPLKAGMPILASGFGLGLEEPNQRAGFISHPAKIGIRCGRNVGPCVESDTLYIPGMSGGPVVNEDGKVVSIVQYTNTEYNYGIGRSIGEIYKATKAYWRN